MGALDSPLRYDLAVPPDGRIELQVPALAGAHVTVIVVEQDQAALAELLAASESSTDFWNNPEDDEDWNCCLNKVKLSSFPFPSQTCRRTNSAPSSWFPRQPITTRQRM